MTDIDGKFRLPSPSKKEELLFTYVGYESLTQFINPVENNLVLKMRSKSTNLKEVKIVAGENPAHRIIKKVCENRDNNNPEKMHSFSYTSYNKMYMTSDLKTSDTLNSLDTSQLKRAKKFLDKQHLFLSESVSERKFLQPNRNYEKVIATRVSGFKESPFSMLATQIQSFSFYNDLINVGGKFYLNPISKGSTSKYLFSLEDTIYKGVDSVFIISYQPRKGKNFDGLKGVLYINTNNYAIQNVIAEPFENSGVISIKIQQQYEFIENKQWFPIQLNTDFIYNIFTITDSASTGKNKSKENQAKMKAIGRSYLKDIVLNPPVKKKEFGAVELETAPDAYSKDEEYWNRFRSDSLNKKDKATYKILDSIGKKENLDLKMKAYEALLAGKIPYKWINIDLNKILNFNDYEGFRLGASAHTNNKIASWFSIGGYFAYGFKDKQVKYGSDFSLTFDRPSETKLTFSYINDVVEPGETQFLDDQKLISSESYRQYLVNWMDKTVQREAAFSFRSLQYLKSNIYLRNIDRTATNDYQFARTDENVTVLTNNYNFTECGLSMRYAFREKFMRTQHNYLVSLGTTFPIVWFQIGKGLNPDITKLGGEFDYWRADFKTQKSFVTKSIGKTTLTLIGGYIIGNLPNTYLYKGHGSYKQYSIASANSFETMRMNEFLSDRYAALFFTHDFGKLLFKTKMFKPEFALVNNVGIGTLANKNNHFGIKIKTMEKGYFESGVLINNLLNSQMIGLGVGVFYRYGTYALPTNKENISLKVSFKINI